ncbi:MAG: efflux RND transporter periplasmic adaptor subunit [Lysobacterales bacterium]|jgi:membrane fusion protein (multidrug efflux system)
MTTITRRVAVLSLLALVLTACEKQQAPQRQMSAPAVTVVTLKEQPVTLSRELPGRTNAYVVAEVRPQVTGIVKDRLFTEGSYVEAGQALYQLDDATYRADYNSAKAVLARAEAAVDIARFNAERAEQLIKTKTISEQELINTQAILKQAEASVGVARAEVASAEVKLDYARITSPIDGRIGKSTVTKGALVTANQDSPLATVQQLDPIYVDLTRSASELLQLRRELSSGAARSTEGIPVTIILEDGTRYAHEGELAFSDVAVDPMTGSYALRVVVPNPDSLLMPGMYVRAIVSNAVLEHGLLVPQKAITRDSKGNASAMVVTSEGTAEQRAVQVSRTVGDQWLVESGLSAGDRVITEGLQKVRPGAPVQPQDADSVAQGPDDGPAAAANTQEQ